MMEKIEEISKGFKVDELFPVKINGIEVRENKNLVTGESDSINGFQFANRPFDSKWLDWDAIEANTKNEINRSLINNLFLVLSMNPGTDLYHVFVSKYPAGKQMLTSYKDNITCSFPLFSMSDKGEQTGRLSRNSRILNLNSNIVSQIASATGLLFISEIAEGNLCFATANPELQDDFKLVFVPIDLFDYIYGVLHSPAFRKMHGKVSEKDFPEIPYPENSEIFWRLVRIGSEFRNSHLMESYGTNQSIIDFPVKGENIVAEPFFYSDRKSDTTGKVFINNSQYFTNISESAWNSFVGDYQPAQQWLRNRKGHKLKIEDILHYRKIIAALSKH